MVRLHDRLLVVVSNFLILASPAMFHVSLIPGLRYAFPPLLPLTISKDIHATTTDVANSNIIALVATLLVRVVAGPLCDLIGPRYTFAACLLAGSLPTALAGCVFNAKGLLALRFFIGILGGSFVPCQVWSTAFFDKNVVGTANSLTGGWGNSGGGITYFVMPAIFDSLVHARHESTHVAWRVTFIVPFILIVTTALLMIALCPDTPTGPWNERHLHVAESLQAHGVSPDGIVAIPGGLAEKPHKESGDGSLTPNSGNDEKVLGEERGIAGAKHDFDHEAAMAPEVMIETARGEVVEKPTFKHAIAVIFTPQTIVPAACYFCSFGAELAINSILGSYYVKNFKLSQSKSGDWAAMFGLLNVVCRPVGGFISDFLYRRTKTVWAKKIWLHALAIICGAFLIAIGVTNSHKEATMFGLVAGMAFFLEASNGANFSLVPHVWPANNGVISGIVGASGNLGGIVFAIIFRFTPGEYGKVFYIIGAIMMGVNLCLCWIPPINKKQIGGR